MTDITLLILAIGMSIYWIKDLLHDFLCANKEIELSIKLKTKG